MKTKPSYSEFVFRTRQHFMWIGVLIDVSVAFGEHSSWMRLTSMFEVHQKRTSGVGFCTIVLLVPSSLVRKPLLGLSVSIYLNSTCFHRLKPFEQEIVSMVIFMQDGAPPHFSCFVTDVLNERLPDAWIGRGGPIPWPPRSPDLSPLDFFLSGTLRTLCVLRR